MAENIWKSCFLYCSIVCLLFIKESEMYSYSDPCSSYSMSYKLQAQYSSTYRPSYFSNPNTYSCYWTGYYNKWIRFSGASTSKITTQCPASSGQACSTVKYNAYLSNGNPQQYQGVVSNTLCLSIPGRCSCTYRVAIQVKNCGGFLVYKMPYSSYLYYCSAVICGESEPKVYPTTPPKPLALGLVAVIAGVSLLVVGIIVSVTVAVKVKRIPPRVNGVGAQPTA